MKGEPNRPEFLDGMPISDATAAAMKAATWPQNCADCNCGFMTAEGKWMMAKCDEERAGFVCEYKGELGTL